MSGGNHQNWRPLRETKRRTSALLNDIPFSVRKRSYINVSLRVCDKDSVRLAASPVFWEGNLQKRQNASTISPADHHWIRHGVGLNSALPDKSWYSITNIGKVTYCTIQTYTPNLLVLLRKRFYFPLRIITTSKLIQIDFQTLNVHRHVTKIPTFSALSDHGIMVTSRKINCYQFLYTSQGLLGVHHC